MAHAALTRIYISVELEDGSVHEDVRILFKDQAAYMKSARINKWSDDEVNQQVFMVWHAGKRDGLWSCTFEDFRDKELLDIDAAQVPVGQDTSEDPTPAS